MNQITKMTEKEFLESINYSENGKEMTVYFNNAILATLSFEGVEDKLQDDEYCSSLAEEVGLQSLLAQQLIYEI